MSFVFTDVRTINQRGFIIKRIINKKIHLTMNISVGLNYKKFDIFIYKRTLHITLIRVF